jgi:hypothetical protein
MSNTLYEQDFYAWANEQSRLLRAGKLSDADIEHIAEEIESMGRSEKRELISVLKVLLTHLLKWQFHPARRGASWEVSITDNREKLEEHLADNPSLRQQTDAAITAAYRRARRHAALETELPVETFPTTCPWLFEQFMDEAFWPDRTG